MVLNHQTRHTLWALNAISQLFPALSRFSLAVYSTQAFYKYQCPAVSAGQRTRAGSDRASAFAPAQVQGLIDGYQPAQTNSHSGMPLAFPQPAASRAGRDRRRPAPSWPSIASPHTPLSPPVPFPHTFPCPASAAVRPPAHPGAARRPLARGCGTSPASAGGFPPACPWRPGSG